MLMVKETYVNATKSRRFGDSGWYEPGTTDRGELFRSYQREFGGCISRMYQDVKNGPPRQVGWVFSRREHYEDARPVPGTNGTRYRDSDRYIREVWVELRDVLTPDEVITRITEAADNAAALAVLAAVPERTLRAVADQLYIEAEGHGVPWLRQAVIAEARS